MLHVPLTERFRANQKFPWNPSWTLINCLIFHPFLHDFMRVGNGFTLDWFHFPHVKSYSTLGVRWKWSTLLEDWVLLRCEGLTAGGSAAFSGFMGAGSSTSVTGALWRPQWTYNSRFSSVSRPAAVGSHLWTCSLNLASVIKKPLILNCVTLTVSRQKLLCETKKVW